MDKMMPIVLDIETSGMDFDRCGIWQIGAIDLSTGEEFFEEGRIDDEDKMVDTPGAAKTVFEVIGKTEEELRDKNKQTQKELLQKFFSWVEKRKMKNFLCQNPHFDVAFISLKARKYGLEMPSHHRAFDLHSIAQTIYHQKNGALLIKDYYSNMGLGNILEMCGLKDERGLHNALEDCKLTAECFRRLLDIR